MRMLIEEPWAQKGLPLPYWEVDWIKSIKDICEELSGTVDFLSKTGQDVGPLAPETRPQESLLTPLQQQLWKALDNAPSSIEQILNRSGLELVSLQQELMHLELRGYV